MGIGVSDGIEFQFFTGYGTVGLLSVEPDRAAEHQLDFRIGDRALFSFGKIGIQIEFVESDGKQQIFFPDFFRSRDLDEFRRQQGKS